jgi:hypothetical protein
MSRVSIGSHSRCEIILKLVYNTSDLHSNMLDRRVLFKDHKELRLPTSRRVRQRSHRSFQSFHEIGSLVFFRVPNGELQVVAKFRLQITEVS